MSRMVARTPARLRLLLGGLAALLVPLLVALAADSPPAVVVTAAAVAVMAALVGRAGRVTTSTGGLPAPSALAGVEAPSFLAARVTDPLHHPRRPRAPGLA